MFGHSSTLVRGVIEIAVVDQGLIKMARLVPPAPPPWHEAHKDREAREAFFSTGIAGLALASS